MSELQFEDENVTGSQGLRPLRPRALQEPNMPKMMQIVINLHLAKDEKTAKHLLISFGITCILLSLAIFIYFSVHSDANRVRYSFSRDVIENLPEEIKAALRK